jgi:hypothetical protein
MRQNKRVNCKEVQGEGAFMVIRPLTFSERRDKSTIDMLMQRVVEWNWTDWEDEPLPLPHTDEARDMLTDHESEFILAQFGMVFAPKEGNGPN